MADDFRVLDAFWRAANYLSVGQIYLLSNPLLREPLTLADVKPRLLGHWGTTPGLNFIYAHLDRVIRACDADVVHVVGPGHGGPGIVANAWLDGTYSERFPDVTLDARGMARLFRQFSFPYGIPSHAAPETPGSINEGGELGYSLAHAYGAAFDNPETTVVCTIGDGEAETGPLAASWHSNKFLDPRRDGAVLPILHLNGFKIANPTILARIGDDELASLMRGYGHEPAFVSGDDPAAMHVAMAAALDAAFDRIAEIRRAARTGGVRERPRYPMIVLRSPKGWTGPRVVDGLPIEGSWRAHQVPLENLADPAHLALLETWLRSYRPHELFGPDGAPVAELRAFAPSGDRRVSANPHANGGLLRRSLDLPDWRANAVDVAVPGRALAASTAVLGTWLRDVMARAANRDSFRIMGPDETASNRLQDVFEVTGRTWDAIRLEGDDAHLAPDGRVMEVLSETTCQGWLEGYLLTGRHGLFNCYEAFTHIVDSMAGQHAKWLEQAARVPWRASVSSLNYLLSSHVWRQDHNGFSHQDPGFVDVVATKKPAIVRVYFPPDANTLLAVADHCLRSVDTINVVVAGKQPELQYLGAAEAAAHVAKGIGVWSWASSDAGREPDLVMACAGDVPTLEALAATQLLREEFPGVAIRFVNVVDLMRLAPRSEHPHGLDDRAFDVLFTRDRPVFFAYHGYPAIVHRYSYNRANHANIHVHGFMEEGTTTTPFDMVVRNRLDRYHLALAAIERVPSLAASGARARERCEDALVAHRAHVVLRGEDLPEITGWTWRS